jgi:aminoglycoside phosphotransferase (APT) family kinase protein
MDAFPGNMLVEGGTVTAVLDFGTVSIVGDRRLDPLAAAAYLAPLITPTATDSDLSVAREWLAGRGLDDLYEAAQRWIAAFWSIARDDLRLHQWCRSILLD